MKLLSFLLFVIPFSCFPQSSGDAKLPIEIPSSYVEDKVGVLTFEQEELLENKIQAFNSQTSSQILLYITDTLYGKTSNEFALELFNMTGIGQKDINNGVLILIAPNEREMRILVGYGMEWPLPDSATQLIVDEMIPFLKEGNYFEASRVGIDRIIEKTQSLPWYTGYPSYERLISDSANSLNKIAVLKVEKMVLPKKLNQSFYSTALLKFKKNKSVKLIFTNYMDNLIGEIKPGKEIVVRVCETNPLTVQLIGVK